MSLISPVENDDKKDMKRCRSRPPEFSIKTFLNISDVKDDVEYYELPKARPRTCLLNKEPSPKVEALVPTFLDKVFNAIFKKHADEQKLAQFQPQLKPNYSKVFREKL